ncbi:MAG: hypothetical protein H6827_00360 [Planctomycetes bacterium]|nr:hypothetical protein [Planctomycetota bacterium]
MSWTALDPDDANNAMVIGDEPWDVLSHAVREVVQLYQRDLNRLPHAEELVRTFQEVLQPSWSMVAQEGQTTELVQIRAKTRRIPKRQKYQIGDVLKATAANGKPLYARVFEPGELMYPAIGVYDSLGMLPDDLGAIIARPLIVKVTPIHHELMEERAWVVVGHRPITGIDQRHPQGPDSLSGENDQLIAANYFYGLSDKKFYGIEQYLVRPRSEPS